MRKSSKILRSEPNWDLATTGALMQRSKCPANAECLSSRRLQAEQVVRWVHFEIPYQQQAVS